MCALLPYTRRIPICRDNWAMNGQASEHAEQRGEAAEPRLTGTPSQIEWAVQIRRTISTEFDRVAAALEAVAQNQSGRAQSSTQAIIAILEEKRIEVLKNDRAGYFIKHWQELTDQVRLLIRE